MENKSDSKASVVAGIVVILFIAAIISAEALFVQASLHALGHDVTFGQAVCITLARGGKR